MTVPLALVSVVVRWFVNCDMKDVLIHFFL